MLFSKKSIFLKGKIYKKIFYLLLSFLIFGIIYYFFCDDYEFGGINILQEEIRKSSVKKFVDKIEKGQINEEVKDEISEKITKGDINKNLDKKLARETRHPSIDESVKKQSNYQKIFDRIYFSIVTGTTLGYGDIYPLSNKVKTLIIFQLLTTITILFY